MAKEFPYFRWFPKDADADEKYGLMDDAELGFFHRCLNKAWVNEGLPADPEERARLLKTPRVIADERWERVGRSFVVSPVFGGKLVNPRQEKEREHAIAKSRAASRSARSKANTPANAPANRNGRNGYHFGYLTDESFKPFVIAATRLWPDLIEEDLQTSWQFTWVKWDFEQKLDCVRKTEARIAAGELGHFVTRPPKYLESGDWKRPPRKAPEPVDKNQTRRDNANQIAKKIRQLSGHQ